MRANSRPQARRGAFPPNAEHLGAEPQEAYAFTQVFHPAEKSPPDWILLRRPISAGYSPALRIAWGARPSIRMRNLPGPIPARIGPQGLNFVDSNWGRASEPTRRAAKQSFSLLLPLTHRYPVGLNALRGTGGRERRFPTCVGGIGESS